MKVQKSLLGCLFGGPNGLLEVSWRTLGGLLAAIWRVLGEPLGPSGGLWAVSGGPFGGSWALLGRPWRLLEAILEAHEAPQRPLERAWRAPGTFLAAFEDPTVNFMKIIDFSLFFRRISVDFQVLGDALEASECSWRPLGALLKPLGGVLRASWEDPWCILGASGGSFEAILELKTCH